MARARVSCIAGRFFLYPLSHEGSPGKLWEVLKNSWSGRESLGFTERPDVPVGASGEAEYRREELIEGPALNVEFSAILQVRPSLSACVCAGVTSVHPCPWGPGSAYVLTDPLSDVGWREGVQHLPAGPGCPCPPTAPGTALTPRPCSQTDGARSSVLSPGEIAV